MWEKKKRKGENGYDENSMMNDASDGSQSIIMIDCHLRSNTIHSFRTIILIHCALSLPSHREHYFASAAWVSQTEVSVVWMNRAQNLSVVTLCKSPMWYCQEVSKE